MSMITPPELETWLCEWLRSRITDVPGLQTDVREPDDYDGSYPLIVVRDDGGAQSNRILFDRSVGVTVRGWTRGNPKPCDALARRVYAHLTADPDILQGHADGSPILAIVEDGCNGPYPVTEDADIARYYMTVEYVASGIES